VVDQDSEATYEIRVLHELEELDDDGSKDAVVRGIGVAERVSDSRSDGRSSLG
jgi:hypothetical protein